MCTARPAWTARKWPTPRCPCKTSTRWISSSRLCGAEPSGTVTLCPIGPLTNIATAFERAPDIIDRVQEIVLMGGAYFEVGNITPTAEFNIYVDPEAAKIVFGAARRWS